MLIYKMVKNIILTHIFHKIGVELWVENKKGKNDPKQEPYFKVSNNNNNYIKLNFKNILN